MNCWENECRLVLEGEKNGWVHALKCSVFLWALSAGNLQGSQNVPHVALGRRLIIVAVTEVCSVYFP